MAGPVQSEQGLAFCECPFTRLLRGLVLFLAIVSGASVMAIIGVTCLDVILRLPFIGRSLVGAYDITRIAGALSLAAALPYTTACKGHVAIDFFSQRLKPRGRLILDTLIRLSGMALFAFLTWRTVLYGVEMLRSGQVSQTLQWPLFWLPWAIGFCCSVVVLVLGHNLLHPDQEMIKP
jgi:TRAP-type C4-dicarboxylate transport system permease small subunit